MRRRQKNPKAAVVVPSDITLVERKLSNGSRSLSLLETIGLATVFPVWRRNWVRNDRKDLKAILKNNFDDVDAKDSETSELLNLVKLRQSQVRRVMICRAAGLVGSILAPLSTWYSFRHYDHKGQVLPLPFALYGGNLIGRATAAWLTGRWAAPLRESSLGNLPSHRFLTETEGDRREPEQIFGTRET
eukprot:Gregarina_sp_Poly_1__4058@NODE_222_length_11242_cov_244_139150_g196_i0_p5_GENE_NODE_222_length_11242_cov_244_139150_g196_i0NODE_222_length_11242_cov_244_139150_g196_i0_p5_ORF_typecomplete_len188_score23_26_NODE_222_length_11242_cov_244_139150_g196_i082978860